MRKKARALSPCTLKRELPSTSNSPHLNKRERKGATTTRALARLKEEEEDKKAKLESDDTLDPKLITSDVSDLSESERGDV